jgi:hypothetical protein
MCYMTFPNNYDAPMLYAQELTGNNVERADEVWRIESLLCYHFCLLVWVRAWFNPLLMVRKSFLIFS